MWPQLVFNTSPENHQLIFDKIVKLYDEIVHLTANDKIENDAVYLFSAQLFDVRGLPAQLKERAHAADDLL